MKRIQNTTGLLGNASSERLQALNSPKKRSKNTKPTNLLTRQIIAYIRDLGGYAERINTTGFYKEDLGKWINGSTRKGTADIHAILKGKAFSIELKLGKDTQSEHQKRTENEVNAAGGIYLIASDFEQFKKDLAEYLK